MGMIEEPLAERFESGTVCSSRRIDRLWPRVFHGTSGFAVLFTMKVSSKVFLPLLCAGFMAAAAAQEKGPPRKEQKKPDPVTLPLSFDRKLNRDGFSFKVTWPAEGKGNAVEIIPSGLSRDNSAVTRNISGAVVNAVVDDLDGDNSPEIYLFVKTMTGKGDVVAFSVDQGRSLAPVVIATPEEDGVKGYRGGDDFRISENRLVRTFPVYREGDADGSPGGGLRQVTYRLYQAGDGWKLMKILVVDI